MPLNIEVRRNNKPVKLVWDELTLNVLLTIAIKEGDPDMEWSEGKTFGAIEAPYYVNVAYTGVYYIDTKAALWKKNRQTLKSDHLYEIPRIDGDGLYRTIDLKKGDVIRMSRS